MPVPFGMHPETARMWSSPHFQDWISRQSTSDRNRYTQDNYAAINEYLEQNPAMYFS